MTIDVGKERICNYLNQIKDADVYKALAMMT
jgi:hypothetical protein